jgi:phage terminase large subunit-like protein
VRYWDLAATEKTEFNDPDWTVGIKLGRDQSGGLWVLDLVRGRANPGRCRADSAQHRDPGRQRGPHRVR